MVQPDIIESRPSSTRRRSWVWVIAVASLVALGFVVARNGRAPLVAAEPSATAGGRHSTADPTGTGEVGVDTVSGSAQPAPVPSVSRAIVEQKVRALGVSLTQSSGSETGQVTDSTTGAELHVTVYLAAGDDGISGIQCLFVMNDIKVDSQLVARAGQCVLLAVPATDQAAVSSWLTANGTAVPAGQSRDYDIDGLRVTVGHITNAFSATSNMLLPTAG